MTDRRRRVFLLSGVVLLIAAVFCTDMITPLGVGEWVFYLPLILVPVSFNGERSVVIVGIACSALVMIGFMLSPPGISFAWGFLNRVMALAALWLTAFAGVMIIRRSILLAAVTARLQQEVAKHEQTELALRESEERIRLAVDGAGMGTWDVDMRSGAVIWSESHFRMLGYEPVPNGAASMEMWRSRIHPDDLERVLDGQEQARRQRKPFFCEHRIVRADNRETVWLAVFGSHLFDESPDAARFLGVSFDVTRHKELEREVLEAASREQHHIGQELHDGVGQELTGLGLMAQALVRRFADGSTERTIAARLVAGLDQAHHQVRSLSRVLVPVQVETKGLRAALEDLAASMSEQSRVPVTFECPRWVDMPDHGTATQLFRIVQEAVSNALRHGQPRHVRVTLLAEPNGLRLRIKDDGIGMRRSPTDAKGLGIRLMEYRAGLIGGVLRIDAAEGGGTVVTCTLPGRMAG